MPEQSNITSFFKRKRCDGDTSERIAEEATKKTRARQNHEAGSERSEESVTMPVGTAASNSCRQLQQLCRTLPILDKNMHAGWFNALRPEFEKPYFKKLNDFVIQERNTNTVYPPANDVFSWARMTSPDDVRVVVLGQDPYHGPDQAHGLAFSVLSGVRAPPSLLNIYKELEQDLTGFNSPDHGCLSGWARQGVLLLNACLTVRAAKPNSHKDKGWEKLTDAVIRYINTDMEHVVFLLWGAYAQKKAGLLDRNRHYILKSVHPSPLSAHRGFLGCRHFSQCNELLSKHGNLPIDWSDLPRQ